MSAVASRVAEFPAPESVSRIVFLMGGKGGVGKTAFAGMLGEWYRAHGTPHTLIDMDTENKACGSLAHFFPQARKWNIHQARGLDEFVDALDEGNPIVVADMGSGAGEVAHRWFDSMYTTVHEDGVVFTAVSLVTPDPASVFSLLSWASFLQQRVDYLVVRNSLTEPADFGYWETDPQAVEFRKAFHPREIGMEYRLPDIEHEARMHGYTIRAVAYKQTEMPILNRRMNVLRAKGLCQRLFAELDRVKDLLLP